MKHNKICTCKYNIYKNNKHFFLCPVNLNYYYFLDEQKHDDIFLPCA